MNNKITIQDLIDLKNENNEILDYLNKQDHHYKYHQWKYKDVHNHYLCKER